MKKILLIVAILLILLGATGAYYFLVLKKGKQTTLPSITSVVGSKIYSTEQLKDMVKSGVSLKCTYKDDEQNYGTSYIKGSQAYSEMVLDGKSIKVIMKDKCIWSWNEKMQGSKMCFDMSFEEMLDHDYTKELKDLQAKISPYPTKPARQYSCSPANISENLFVLPTDVNFVDLDAMEKQKEEMMRNYQQENLEQEAEVPEEEEIPE